MQGIDRQPNKAKLKGNGRRALAVQLLGPDSYSEPTVARAWN